MLRGDVWLHFDGNLETKNSIGRQSLSLESNLSVPFCTNWQMAIAVNSLHPEAIPNLVSVVFIISSDRLE
ncbi:hypothetical protein OKW24_003450 [Peribacillus simplex]|nr:hypothetical protein [Peribacillus simplex]